MDCVDKRDEFLKLIDSYSQYLATEIANSMTGDLNKAFYISGARDAILFMSSYIDISIDDIRIDDLLEALNCELDLEN